MAKVKFRKEELEDLGSYEEMEKIAFEEETEEKEKSSRRKPGSVPRK